MFFEMLILGTRNCINLSQPEAYEDITIKAKENLWDVCDRLNDLNVHTTVGQHEDEEQENVVTPTQNRKGSS